VSFCQPSADSDLTSAIASIPVGSWAVAVSGGADSVALLRACAARAQQRGDLSLHVVHLNHELRGQSAAADAAWVADLAASLRLPCTVARRCELENNADALPRNLPARMRALRLRLFAGVCREHHLAGVLLGHHRDDQAETILQRLIRGASIAGLAGMSEVALIAGLTLRRPLLELSRQSLRDYLNSLGQSWREDLTNALPSQQRNRARMFLADRPQLTQGLLALARACQAWRGWAIRLPAAPAELDARFGMAPICGPISAQISAMPRCLARVAAAHWLVDRGVPAQQMSPDLAQRLLDLIDDVASPSANFPGNIRVRHRRGKIIAEPAPGPLYPGRLRNQTP
jgi:tRNA(Ile)-lysidine synthetase-like protein